MKRSVISMIVMLCALLTGCSHNVTNDIELNGSASASDNSNVTSFRLSIKGELIDDADFNRVRIKLTEDNSSVDWAREGNEVLCVFTPRYVNGDNSKISLIDLENVFIKGRGVILSFDTADAYILKENDVVSITPVDTDVSDISLIPYDPDEEYIIDDEFKEHFYDENGDMIMLTREEYEQWKQQRSSEK